MEVVHERSGDARAQGLRRRGAVCRSGFGWALFEALDLVAQLAARSNEVFRGFAHLAAQFSSRSCRGSLERYLTTVSEMAGCAPEIVLRRAGADVRDAVAARTSSTS